MIIFLIQVFHSKVKLEDRGGTVVKVLRYKSDGRWFDPRWCHWNFPLTQNPSDRTITRCAHNKIRRQAS